MSSFAVKMCQVLGIKQNASTAFHPWTDGQSERTNQKLEQFLRLYMNAKQDNWVHFLWLAEFAFNSWCNESTKKSPFKILMGYNPRAEWTTVSSPVPQVTHHLEQIQEGRSQASVAIWKAQLGWIKIRRRSNTCNRREIRCGSMGAISKHIIQPQNLHRNATDHSQLRESYLL